MIVSPADSQKASTICQQQRFAMRDLMQVDRERATHDELGLFDQVKASTTPKIYDAYLGDQRVSSALCRRVFFFAQQDFNSAAASCTAIGNETPTTTEIV